MYMVSNERRRAGGDGRHLGCSSTACDCKSFFFFKVKTQLLNVEFAMNPAEILFED